MRMKKIYLLFCLLALALSSHAQQDAQYNLYQFNQLVINPAYAGARDAIAVVASVRSQWVGFDGAPKTNCLSVHSPVMNKKLGVGLTVVNDKMGPRNTFGAYANVAYILKIDRKTKLSFGLNAGYNRYQFNFSKLTFNSSEIPADFSQSQNLGVLDLNAGLYLRGSGYFVGISATHLNVPTVYSYADQVGNKYAYKLSSHLFVTAGKSFVVNDNLIFAPTVLVKNVKNKVTADINLNFFIYRRLWLGAFYRSGYGPGALFQYYINNAFKVGYSYDSGLKDARRLGGSHEVMIGYEFASPKSKMINPRFL